MAETALGAYRLVAEVARGGQGTVWEGLAPDGRRVAIKVLLPERRSTAEGRARFDREARALLRLRHPGVVELLDGGVDGENQFLVMGWVDGETLEDKVLREGPMAPRAAAHLVRQVALAVAYCHAQGVLHRDIKPSNVLVRRSDGAPILSDFGIARQLELEARDGTTTLNLTLRGRSLGTPAFWSPECALGRVDSIGPQSDVYGLGGLLYFTLTGVCPNQGDTLVEQLAALLADRSRSPRETKPDLPAPLDHLTTHCLARDLAKRPPTAQVVAKALEAWLARVAAPTEPTPPVRAPVPRPATPRPGPPQIKVLRVRQPEERPPSGQRRIVIKNPAEAPQDVPADPAAREQMFVALIDQVVAQGTLEAWKLAFLRRLAPRFALTEERVDELIQERGGDELFVSPTRGQ